MRTDIYEILDAVSNSSCEMVLATIIDVKGSAYKREGATMLLNEVGQHVGLLSGGCLEQDLFAQIKDFFSGSYSTVLTYDLTAEDDLSWGQGAGCNGIVTIVVEPITSMLRNDLSRVKDLVNQGIDVTHVKRMTMGHKVRDYLFYTEKGEVFGQWKGELPIVNKIEENKLTKEKDIYLFKQKIAARPRLFIYGAGIDAIALASLAYLTGFQVIIADWRPAYCNETNFPFPTKTVVASPFEFVQSFTFLSSDSIVLMTHNYEKDYQLVHSLLKKKLGYLGLLGSKARAEKIVRGVRIPEWVHFPVGLSIGAEGPQEIAISIMAELIQTKSRRLACAL